MDWKLDGAGTLAVAALVLITGRRVIERVAFLRAYSIPEPVVGGLAAAVIVALLHAAGIRIAFDTSLQPGLMLAFFTTIGLGADAKMLARGGTTLLLFAACIVAMLVMQNLIGLGAAKAMGLDPIIGLIAGSVTMAGGHGTGAAWGQKFADNFDMAAAPSIALSSATFGLIMGGLLGGPIARRLVDRLQARGAPLGLSTDEAMPHDDAESREPFTAQRLTVTILLIATCVTLGAGISRWTDNPILTLPTFVWTLFVGAVIRNLLAMGRLHEIDGDSLAFVSVVSLSLFLAMALMTLRLWEIAALALPMFVILVLQATGVALFSTFVTFRVMGSNYEAAVMVAGQCGFGLGATPTAIANMQAITDRFGYAPRAILVVSMVGAFLIDIANAIVISIFAGFVPIAR